jgi:glycosyltransferase involved in cell wall biosynthesis
VRVLFLSQIVPYPPHGGVLQRGYNLLRELGRIAEVHLLAFVHPDELRTEDAVEESRAALGEFCCSVDYYSLWPKSSRAHFGAALAVSACSPSPFSVIAHRSVAYKRRVRHLIQVVSPEIIHVDTVALSQFAPVASRRLGVLTHHNLESLLMKRRAEVENAWHARWFMKREARKLEAYEVEQAPTFALNIMMSAADERSLRQLAPNVRTAVVPNGVDVGYFTPREPDDRLPPSVVYTGGMNMFANRDAVLHFLREIWPRLSALVPDVRFIAVGQDPPGELLAAAESDARIVATGFVPDIRPFVAQASVYVVPLRVGGGTRLKVLDAMAMGKALVSTSVGCEGIDVRPGEHVLVADSADRFAEVTAGLLRDGPRRQALGRAARERVESCYAWPHVGRLLLNAYESVSRERNGPA